MKDRNLRKEFIWNTINSLLNSAMSAVLLLVVNRVSGESIAGAFALAFSIAQLMLTIGWFEQRAYQLTDISNEHSEKNYYSFKIITCLSMIVFSVIYIFFQGLDLKTSVLCFLLCLFKMFDAFEDFYVAMYQKEGNLAYGAMSSSLRIGISIVLFSVLMLISKNIFVAVVSCIIFYILYTLKIYVFKINAVRAISFCFDVEHFKKMFKDCFPAFIGAYLSLYVGNAPKYALERYMERRFQTYYGIIYMPSFVINLFCGFFFKPIVADLADAYYHDKKKYRLMCIRIFEILIIISLVTIVCGGLLGTQILGMLYGVNLEEYKFDLGIILLGGAIGAVGQILYYLIMIIRQQKWVLLGNAITGISAFVFAPMLVSYYGIRGASWGFVLFNIVRVGALVLIYSISTVIMVRRANKGEDI